MDRRKSLKIIFTGAVAAPAVLAGCNPDVKSDIIVSTAEPVFNLDRNPEEIKNEKRLLALDKFFTEHEMTTIAILADIIIPADEVSGSATDAKVPEFIEFIVKDMPYHQTPIRGGLRWLDVHCMKRFEKSFKDCNITQQLEVVDEIAYPDRKIKPGMKQGVAFFNKMRDMVATGFYTTEIGVKDIGYLGNTPTQWNGVPEEVLSQYKLAYTEKELKECVSYNKK
jgi:hypothetical protein